MLPSLWCDTRSISVFVLTAADRTSADPVQIRQTDFTARHLLKEHRKWISVSGCDADYIKTCPLHTHVITHRIPVLHTQAWMIYCDHEQHSGKSWTSEHHLSVTVSSQITSLLWATHTHTHTHTHTRTHAHAHAHARTHTRTHTHGASVLPNTTCKFSFQINMNNLCPKRDVSRLIIISKHLFCLLPLPFPLHAIHFSQILG